MSVKTNSLRFYSGYFRNTRDFLRAFDTVRLGYHVIMNSCHALKPPVVIDHCQKHRLRQYCPVYFILMILICYWSPDNWGLLLIVVPCRYLFDICFVYHLSNGICFRRYYHINSGQQRELTQTMTISESQKVFFLVNLVSTYWIDKFGKNLRHRGWCNSRV